VVDGRRPPPHCRRGRSTTFPGCVPQPGDDGPDYCTAHRRCAADPQHDAVVAFLGAARWWLRLLIAVGFIGSGFHAYGIQRNMGGWRNWSQNLLNGPPLPAPPAFTALAISGLTALDLIEEEAQ
jgi:hypothetical protein